MGNRKQIRKGVGMAGELETAIMSSIGLGNHYSWHNGSGSCEYTRNGAVEKLQEVANMYGLTVSTAWLALCNKATRVDEHNGEKYTLTNTWISCSDAIQDAVYQKAGSVGLEPLEKWVFGNKDKRMQWEFDELRRELRERGMSDLVLD